MKPSIQKLGEILYSPSQYIIPVFQRNYRWETPQWAQFWESLMAIQNPEKKGNHFMGFLVFVPGLPQPGQHTRFSLIDGQQRLTTSSILLAAVRNVARRLGQKELEDEIHGYYLVHPLKKGSQHFRLLPKEKDHDSYVALVSGDGTPTGRMAAALAYFEEQLSSDAAETPDRLRQVFDTACQRLEFMCATLETENAYNIFKSLNSTGVPLGSSDLIRNFVFMHLPPDEHDEFDRQQWKSLENHFVGSEGSLDEERFSRFFRDFLMTDGQYVSPKDTFPRFEERYEATEFAPRVLARSLNEAAEFYAVIRGEREDESLHVTEALARMNELESETAYPLLLSLLRSRSAGRLDSLQLAQAVEMLRGFIIRRFVCGQSSRGYGQMFVRAAARSGKDPLKDLEAYLVERGWPDDHEFELAFVDFPLYSRGYTKEILVALERARGHKEPAALGATQVEHIMPQKLSAAWLEALGPNADQIHAEWLQRPGNLTLSAYNQELWNHPFETKKEFYAQSNIELTKELAGYGRWTEDEILQRGRQLARAAAAIWVGPRPGVISPGTDGDSESEGPSRFELRSSFWDGLNDHLAAHHPGIKGFETRPKPTLRLPSGVRHVGLEVRLGLKHGAISVDLFFWRSPSFEVFKELRKAPEEISELMSTPWEFDVSEQGVPPGRASVSLQVQNIRDESCWPSLFEWFGEKLSRFYVHVSPVLRERISQVEGGPA